ncbi:MAG: allantoinase AllB, partial [Candidatus Eisenbacteria bacterium]
VLPGGIGPATLFVADGAIAAVGALDAPVAEGVAVLEAGDLVVLPGLVDTHVHANEPGRTDWEGLDAATRAAAAGGVTTIVDMPLNSIPPTTSAGALEVKRAAARGRVWTDVAFWGGAVPGNEAELGSLARAGVCGVKAFLADSGVPEFGHLDEADLAGAMAECARQGLTLIVHAELPGALKAPAAGDRRYASWLASRPAAAELEAIALLVRHAQRLAAAGAVVRVHVVHLSAAGALPLLAVAQAEGLAISAETCPHYLALAAEEIEDGATLCKCAPPIRDAANRDRLWQGLADGTIALVASDHSPSPPAGKALDDGDFARAWGGISSLGLGLAVVWAAAGERGFDLSDVARWMAAAPARLAGLAATKGELAPGHDADFVLFDADARWTVTPQALWTRHRITPYAGRTVRGRERATYLRGQRIYAADAAGAGDFEGAPRGQLLMRGQGRP